MSQICNNKRCYVIFLCSLRGSFSSFYIPCPLRTWLIRTFHNFLCFVLLSNFAFLLFPPLPFLLIISTSSLSRLLTIFLFCFQYILCQFSKPSYVLRNSNCVNLILCINALSINISMIHRHIGQII